MDARETRHVEQRELEALLRTCVAAGLIAMGTIDGEVRYHITEFGRSLPPMGWFELVAPHEPLP